LLSRWLFEHRSNHAQTFCLQARFLLRHGIRALDATWLAFLREKWSARALFTTWLGMHHQVISEQGVPLTIFDPAPLL